MSVKFAKRSRLGFFDSPTSFSVRGGEASLASEDNPSYFTLSDAPLWLDDVVEQTREVASSDM